MAKKSGQSTILQYVSFALGKEIFSIDVMKIHGVERIMEITIIPDYPDFIEGVINLRGQIIPIIELRKRFRIPPAEHGKETRIMLVEINKMIVGIIVDRVFEVLQFDEHQIGQMPKVGTSTVKQKFVLGVVEQKNNLVILLDIDKLFTEEEAITLSASV